MSFIAQDFDKLDIITVPEERTQAVIRNHFLRYNRAVRCQVKIITMGMFSPYYDLAKQLFRVLKSFSIVFTLRYYISELRLKQSTGPVLLQHLSRAISRLRVQIMNQFERKSHE